MRDELDKKLCAKYPLIFAQRHDHMSTTCMCWGICVGDGWYDLIDSLCATIQNDYNNAVRQYDNDVAYNAMVTGGRAGDFTAFDEYYKGFAPDFLTREREGISVGAISLRKIPNERPTIAVAVQVKEKFGGLCFYVDGASPAVYGAISLAESISYRICEDCGKPGKPTQGGWISVKCRDHMPVSEIHKLKATDCGFDLLHDNNTKE